MTVMKQVKPEYIVYCSNTGHTLAYAKMFADETGLPLIKLDDAVKKLPAGSKIIFFGWVMNGIIQGYRQVKDCKFDVCAVVSCGLFGRGANVKALRNVTGVDWEIPFFPLKGGVQPGRLGPGLRIMYMTFKAKMTKEFKLMRNPTPLERDMMRTLANGGNYVKRKYIQMVFDWYETWEYEEQYFEDDFSNDYEMTMIEKIDDAKMGAKVLVEKEKKRRFDAEFRGDTIHKDGYIQRKRSRADYEGLYEGLGTSNPEDEGEE